MLPCCAAEQLLVKWWSDYPAQLLEQRVVAPIQSYLTKELMATKKLTIGVMNAIKVSLHVAVCQAADCLPTQTLPTQATHLSSLLLMFSLFQHNLPGCCFEGMTTVAGRAVGLRSTCACYCILHVTVQPELFCAICWVGVHLLYGPKHVVSYTCSTTLKHTLHSLCPVPSLLQFAGCMLT